LAIGGVGEAQTHGKKKWHVVLGVGRWSGGRKFGHGGGGGGKMVGFIILVRILKIFFLFKTAANIFYSQVSKLKVFYIIFGTV